LRELCLALPDAWEKLSHGEPTFWVKKRMFATFADAANHHGAGRHAVWCLATPATQDLLVSRSPDRYFVPPYVGPSGWIGIYLDRRPSWGEVTERLRHSYELARDLQTRTGASGARGARRARGAKSAAGAKGATE